MKRTVHVPVTRIPSAKPHRNDATMMGNRKKKKNMLLGPLLTPVITTNHATSSQCVHLRGIGIRSRPATRNSNTLYRKYAASSP